ncbi:MAG: pyridoxal phosphate-dependent decarboxylase family protein [Candidatus Dormibacteria bacterium]
MTDDRNTGARPTGDMDPDAYRDAAHRVAEWTADYLRDVERLPVLSPAQPGALRDGLPQSPPRNGEPISAVLADIDELLIPATTHWQSPGFMAYFASSGSGPGILGETLAAALNVNAMLWRTAPAATELEQVTLDWLRQMVGLPRPIFGVINDTASSSTLYALAAAREAQSDLRIRELGMAGRPELPPLRYYASTEAHSSVEKAGIVLGIGRDGLRRIPVDERFRMDPVALRQAIHEDVAAGMRPFAVVGTAGTTSTTSVDPLPAIAALCEQHGLWLHVDAAYGGAAAIAPELRWVLDGAERADSIVINPHKWLFTPTDCSVLWTRRPDVLRGAFSIVPEYLTTTDGSQQDAPNLMDYGTSLGRRMRALKLWMVIRYFGSEGLAQRIREHCEYASTLARWVEGERDFELLAPAPLSVVCLRAHPPGLDDPGTLDTLNQRIVERINTGGRFFLSHTKLRGEYAIRVAFGNLRQEQRHARGVIAALRGAIDDVR